MCENAVSHEVRRRLDKLLTAGTQPDLQQLLKCVQPAIDKYNDLVSDNKRLSVMQHFVLAELNDVKAKNLLREKERQRRKLIPKADVAIQEPEAIGSSSDEDSSSEDEKPAGRPVRPRPAVKLNPIQESGFQNGITDAAMLDFDPLSKPIATPWKQRRRPKSFFNSFKNGKSTKRKSSAEDTDKPSDS